MAAQPSTNAVQNPSGVASVCCALNGVHCVGVIFQILIQRVNREIPFGKV